MLALHDLKARYGDLVDARFSRGAVVAPDRLAELAGRAAALFTEDGVWDGGPGLGVARGREEIAARLASPTLVFSRHLFVRPRIHVDGRAGHRAVGPAQPLHPAGRDVAVDERLRGRRLRPGRRRLAPPVDDPDHDVRVARRDGVAEDPRLIRAGRLRPGRHDARWPRAAGSPGVVPGWAVGRVRPPGWAVRREDRPPG